MTYNAVLSLQARIPPQLDRCWTQEPVILEDALGRVTPFHLEFIDSWEVGPIKSTICRVLSWSLRHLNLFLRYAFDNFRGIVRLSERNTPCGRILLIRMSTLPRLPLLTAAFFLVSIMTWVWFSTPRIPKTVVQPVWLIRRRRLTQEWSGEASTYDSDSACLLLAVMVVVSCISG